MITSIINFNDKKILKSDFYNKNKKIFNIGNLILIKYQSLKKNKMVSIIHFGYLIHVLGIMIMILLDYYIYFFHK